MILQPDTFERDIPMRTLFNPFRAVVPALLLLFAAGIAAAQDFAVPGAIPPSPISDPAEVTLVGDWRIKVVYRGKSEIFDVDPPETVTVTDEKYDRLDKFNPAGPPWHRATPLQALKADECSVENALVPGTTVVTLRPGGEALEADKDYILDEPGANIGWKEGGKIGPETTVYISYKYVPMRIDSIVCVDNRMRLVPGAVHAVNPVPPELEEGEIRLANIYVCHETKDRLTDDNLYPILDDGTLRIPREAVAKKLLPKTWKKLHDGEPLKILAWGDSVTVGRYAAEEEKWQNVFLKRLRERFPGANIELVTQAWGGRTTAAYLAEPSGSEYNYREKVLDLKPDLIISEFVNDFALPREQLEVIYPRLKTDFDAIGAEWIIVGPHYIRPNWMGLTSQKNCDDDPRPYTAFIRSFGGENDVPVAETPILYGRLWRQGVPYNTLMVNNINHPNAYGLSLFADALMALFGTE